MEVTASPQSQDVVTLGLVVRSPDMELEGNPDLVLVSPPMESEDNLVFSLNPMAFSLVMEPEHSLEAAVASLATELKLDQEDSQE